MALLRTAGAWGSSEVHSGRGSGVLLRSTSEVAALQHIKEQLEAQQSRAGVRSHLVGPAARQAAAARRRRRSQLSRVLVVALVVAFLTGTTSYRMHLAIKADQDPDEEPGALSGLRSWLGSGRRSLRQGPSGDELLATYNGYRDPGAQGVQLHQEWWLIGGATPAALEQQQQDEAIDSSPIHRLVRARRLQPASLRVYDFEQHAWVQQHALTRFPPELPVSRWAVASLLNRMKKKESSIFLVGGTMSMAEAEGRPPRPPGGSSSGGSGSGGGGNAAPRTGGSSGGGGGSGSAFGGSLRPLLDGGCPLASAGAYSLNVGRGKVRALPPLPAGRFGGTAVVAGARLHYFGGWATPDRTSRLAVPAMEHWSIGLNADGSSAPEWQPEQPLPEELRGVGLRAVALSTEQDGEPAIYVWHSPTSSSESGIDGSSNPACHADGSGLEAGPRRRGPVQLWSYTGSGGWHMRGTLPKPVGDDFQCAVATSPHTLLAVGGVERAGLFTKQRGIWQYNAHEGSWTRAGWAPVAFEGHLCALHDGRLFVNTALPQEPSLEADELEALEAEAEAEAAAAAQQTEEADPAAAAGQAAAGQAAGQAQAMGMAQA